VLAFDCSTARGSVAVVENGVTFFAEAFDSPRGRGGDLFPALDRALRSVGSVDRVAVGIGPGSYNGLRTAIAAAEGLHIATGAERVGLVSPRALDCAEREYFALGDARGGVLWVARIVDGEVAEDFELLPTPELLARLEARPAVPRFSAAPPDGIPNVGLAAPSAEGLARLAATGPAATRAIEPLYLKPAHITQPRPRGNAR
jgi:tRNA threonylcarbamoyl adenosine modification protein YeaZ